jgi:hypothetical protein
MFLEGCRATVLHLLNRARKASRVAQLVHRESLGQVVRRDDALPWAKRNGAATHEVAVLASGRYPDFRRDRHIPDLRTAALHWLRVPC